MHFLVSVQRKKRVFLLFILSSSFLRCFRIAVLHSGSLSPSSPPPFSLVVVVFFFFSPSLVVVRSALCPIFFDFEAVVCFSLWWMSKSHKSRHNNRLLAGCYLLFYILLDTATDRYTISVRREHVYSTCISISQWFLSLLLLLFSVRYRHHCQT